MKQGIVEITKEIHIMGIDDSLDFLLDCFCDYFVTKGIVTVEYCDYEQEMQNKHKKITIPFIKKRPNKTFSLVIDLDETLIHYYSEKKEVRIRPFAKEFLKEMSKFYEIIIFTAA